MFVIWGEDYSGVDNAIPLRLMANRTRMDEGRNTTAGVSVVVVNDDGTPVKQRPWKNQKHGPQSLGGNLIVFDSANHTLLRCESVEPSIGIPLNAKGQVYEWDELEVPQIVERIVAGKAWRGVSAVRVPRFRRRDCGVGGGWQIEFRGAVLAEMLTELQMRKCLESLVNGLRCDWPERGEETE